jgi:putative autotransporter adhesin-like protein
MRAVIGPIVLSAALLLNPGAAFSQAVDKVTDLKPFDTLEIGGCFESHLTAGTPERVVVNATGPQQARIRVAQDGKTVRVGFIDHAFADEYNVCKEGKIRVSVTANFAKDQAVELRLAGSGGVDADVPRVAKLTVGIAGSGGVTLRGAADECQLNIAGSGGADARALDCGASAKVAVAGSGSTRLNGKTKACEFRVSGSGGVRADDFACESADVAISGSGSISLPTVADLRVSISGSGSVEYRGEPTLRGINIQGSGRLHKL